MWVAIVELNILKLEKLETIHIRANRQSENGLSGAISRVHCNHFDRFAVSPMNLNESFTNSLQKIFDFAKKIPARVQKMSPYRICK